MPILSKKTYRTGGVTFSLTTYRVTLSQINDTATQFSLTLVIKNSYNKKVGIGAEKWPSGRRRLTRNQLSGLPFREFESHLLRHFCFYENLTKSKTPLASGVFAFLSPDAIDRNIPESNRLSYNKPHNGIRDSEQPWGIIQSNLFSIALQCFSGLLRLYDVDFRYAQACPKSLYGRAEKWP